MGQQQEGVERLACMGMEGMITRGLAVITGAGGKAAGRITIAAASMASLYSLQ